jgi:hypothetical protein
MVRVCMSTGCSIGEIGGLACICQKRARLRVRKSPWDGATGWHKCQSCGFPLCPLSIHGLVPAQKAREGGTNERFQFQHVLNTPPLPFIPLSHIPASSSPVLFIPFWAPHLSTSQPDLQRTIPIAMLRWREVSNTRHPFAVLTPSTQASV